METAEYNGGLVYLCLLAEGLSDGTKCLLGKCGSRIRSTILANV